MKILLAIDHSCHSAASIRSVAERPWPSDTVMRILSVVRNTPPSAAELWSEAGGNLETVRALRREFVQKTTGNAAEWLRARGITAETMVLEGNPRRVIVDQARQWHADLIVLAPHFTGTLDRWISGSISWSVVKRAPCSVELFRDKERSP
jgi:nucleotide-binding universal stress UspA family protein